MTNRWFTDAAANGPAPITPEFTGFERGIFTAILAFAQDPANSDMELLHCLDAAGTTSFDRSTGRKAAPITPAMREAMGAGCVRHWHNHPSQDSLSHHDWRCAGASADLEIMALNERGSIFVGRVPEWEDRLEGLFAWLPRLGGDLELHMDGLAKDRRLDPATIVALSRFTGHVLNIALARRTAVRYAYRLLAGDGAAIAACDTRGVVSDGIAFAEAAIREWLNDHAPD